MHETEVAILLDEFRRARREFIKRACTVPTERWLTALPGAWSTRDVVVHAAAWIDEANDGIPRLMAGAPPRDYDVDAFNAQAIARAAEWTPEQALGAFRRAADRFEAIVGESDASDIADCDDAMQWLRSIARTALSEHFDELSRLATAPVE
jgi:hypothetical protein